MCSALGNESLNIEVRQFVLFLSGRGVFSFLLLAFWFLVVPCTVDIIMVTVISMSSTFWLL